MELVHGSNFLQYVRARSASPPAGETLDPTMSEPPAEGKGHASEPGWTPPRVLPFDPARLRDALRQTASGLSALHEAGKLHRDIKPSNVLVTPEGRVVMLDFGLVTEFDPFGENGSLSLVGTPAYMSPEQGSRIAVSEKSDWYSLGVMFYEALTERQPFGGTFMDMMWEKNRSEPPVPRTLLPVIPEDLNALCMDLLRRDPRGRPTAAEILRRLGVAPNAAPATPDASSLSLRPGPFVGRKRELSALREAFDAS